mmetsp:Transcript_25989/g.54971  ORF Transcript_25989/g.54971 Transcript_25989/m.54971 type:complete len:234 (-) Transcript_25989:708-1409(-)
MVELLIVLHVQHHAILPPPILPCRAALVLDPITLGWGHMHHHKHEATQPVGVLVKHLVVSATSAGVVRDRDSELLGAGRAPAQRPRGGPEALLVGVGIAVVLALGQGSHEIAGIAACQSAAGVLAQALGNRVSALGACGDDEDRYELPDLEAKSLHSAVLVLGIGDYNPGAAKSPVHGHLLHLAADRQCLLSRPTGRVDVHTCTSLQKRGHHEELGAIGLLEECLLPLVADSA